MFLLPKVRAWSRWTLPAVILGSSLCVMAMAQVASIDTNDPALISYDEDPNLYAPEIPEYPTVIYSDGTATSTITDPVTGEVPTVTTGEPDTYTLSRATVYYTAPTEPSATPRTGGPDTFRFDFGPGPVASGYTQVLQSAAYSPAVGYGWGDISRVSSRDRGGPDPITRDFCLPNATPFYVDLPNGTYDVGVVVGDAIGKSNLAVRAEGHLELYSIGAPAGQYGRDSFRIKVTDGRMRLEFFAGICPINAITIAPTPQSELDKTSVYLAGDSTVSPYGPAAFPITGWGVPLQNYFTDDVRIANHAKPGRSSKSFYEEGSLGAITNLLKPGDYLFVMFAINDSADDNSNRKTRAESTFKAYLRVYVNAAREKGAIPVFVTSQTKRTFDPWGRFTNSVGPYPQAMRELGPELDVPVIDLNRLSIEFFTAIGPEAAKNSYMYLAAGQYPAYPNGRADYIHFQYNGADQLARLVALDVREQNLQPLASFVRDDRPDGTR